MHYFMLGACDPTYVNEYKRNIFNTDSTMLTASSSHYLLQVLHCNHCGSVDAGSYMFVPPECVQQERVLSLL